MYKIFTAFYLFFITVFLISCQGMNQMAQNGTMQENIRGVTPNDVKSFTKKIISNEYQFDMSRMDETQSSLYYETEWKDLDLIADEEEKGFRDARLRIKIRTQKLRRGMDEYPIHNLKFTADLQGITPESNGNFVNLEITPAREDYIKAIFQDFKTEFDAGVMEY